MGALALAVGLLAANPAPSPVFVVVDGAAGKAAYGDRWSEVIEAAKALSGGDAARILDAGEVEKKALPLRDWLAQRVPRGATIVLAGDEDTIPTWHVRVANAALTTDSHYSDLDGDGVPETAVARLPDGPDAVRRLLGERKEVGGKAVILCSEDTRIHLETRAFLFALSDLGYDVAVRGVPDDPILAAADLIVHFGHGSPSGLFNRFGEVFVEAASVPPLARAPLVFVDGCGTLPVGSPLLRAFFEKGAAAYAGSTATVFGMTPARFTNELVEHFLRALAEDPDSTLPQILMAARAAYVEGHPGLAERLRQLAATGELAARGDEAFDVLTVIEWIYHGDPRVTIRRAGPPREPCRRALRLREPVRLEGEGASWKASYEAAADGRTILAVCADIPLAERAVFRLAVRQNDAEIAILDGRRDTVYQQLGDDCRGGHISGETYRARFLIPLRSGAGEQRVEIVLARGIRAALTEGTEVDVWAPDFEKAIGLRTGPVAPGPAGSRTPVKVEGKAALKATGAAGFLALDLSPVFNSRHGSTRVGGGDNASFATWFDKDEVKADGVPFIVKRTGDDVLVSANNTENVFEIAVFEANARTVYLLVWAYNRPRRPARLALVFADGTAQTFEIPLLEWTEGRPGFAFDFRNTVAAFRHAAIYRHSIEVESPEKMLVGIRSGSGTYGLIAVTIEQAPKSRGADPDSAGWYAFRPANDAGPSAIGMEDWIEKPAGKRGRIAREGEALTYGGRPIKLWGLNLCFGNCAPEKGLAEKRAAFYAKFGINSVRLHKYADGPGWSGIQSRESCVEFDAAALDRMDYLVARFKEAGIYVLLSAHFGALKLGPADRKYVPYIEEFGAFGGGDDRIATPHSAIHYSPELQDAHIRQTVNLLRHRNPYTGMTYAEDPAIAFVEIINEQSILFFTSMAPLKASPTLRKDVARRFSDWLRRRCGSQAKLREAWGEKAFDSFEREGFKTEGESIDAGNVLPLGNPWFWDPAQLAGSQTFRRRRLLDTLEFLYETQCAFYDRYAKAVRDAGYEGEVLASNWQAGRALSHLYNLHSDARIGTVDRHNYFGGGGGKPGERFNDASMLRVAGSEMLSSGLQQVAGRPFMLSEWIHVFPNEWGVEGPAIIAAYGLGLQGWDVSYMFQNGDGGGFSDRIGRDRWDVTAPQVLGVFPAVARQILRGDVKESEVRATMYVHVPSLGEGKLGFEDRTAQAHDLKGFDCDKVPARSLAVARCAVEFTDTYRDTPVFDIGSYERDGALVSSTGELRWKEGREGRLAGYFTVNTPGTKAVVGFAEGENCELGEVTIAPACRFAAIYVTAAERDETIATAKRLLVVAMARARNTGMRLNAEENEILERGKGPILLEPVKARITVGGRRIRAVNVLDCDGRRMERTLPVAQRTVAIDGARDGSPYYEVLLAASP